MRTGSRKNINLQDEDGQTPLFYAHDQSLSILLRDPRVDPNVVSHAGKNVLHDRIHVGYKNDVQVLLARMSFEAIQQREKECKRICMVKDPETRESIVPTHEYTDGKTILQKAIDTYDPYIIEWFCPYIDKVNFQSALSYFESSIPSMYEYVADRCRILLTESASAQLDYYRNTQQLLNIYFPVVLVSVVFSYSRLG
jgi:hypothetical protein